MNATCLLSGERKNVNPSEPETPSVPQAARTASDAVSSSGCGHEDRVPAIGRDRDGGTETPVVE